MRLYELFELTEDSNTYLAATERFILSCLLPIKAVGGNKIYLSALEKELSKQARTPGNSIMPIDREYIMDYLETLKGKDGIISEIKPINNPNSKESDFEIVFTSKKDYTPKPGESEQDKKKDAVAKGASKALKSKDKEKKDSAKDAELSL